MVGALRHLRLARRCTWESPARQRRGGEPNYVERRLRRNHCASDGRAAGVARSVVDQSFPSGALRLAGACRSSSVWAARGGRWVRPVRLESILTYYGDLHFAVGRHVRP